MRIAGTLSRAVRLRKGLPSLILVTDPDRAPDPAALPEIAVLLTPLAAYEALAGNDNDIGAAA